MSERDERVERIAAVLHDWFGYPQERHTSILEVADAVLAVLDEDRDAEIAGLRRVIDSLILAHQDEAERAEADLATERARVARVEALQPAAARSGDGLSISVILPADLRRALSPDAEGGGE